MKARVNGNLPGAGLPILTYHAIDATRSVTATDPAWFAETLAALSESGHRAVDLGEWIAAGRPDVGRGFALAFDDGLRSILSVADLLARHRVPATAFLVTDRMGRDNAWPGQPPGIPRTPILSWSDLDALHAAGVRFAAHGRTHRQLDRFDNAALDDELRTSREAIEQRVSRPCRLLAYPYGISTARVRRAAARHFDAAFGTRLDYASAFQDPHNLSRIDTFYLRSRRALDLLTSGRWHPWLRMLRMLRSARRLAARRRHAGLAVPTVRPVAQNGSTTVRIPGMMAQDDLAHDEAQTQASDLVCPACLGALAVEPRGRWCAACARSYPDVAGLGDLRLESDRYLDLKAERARAECLRAIEPTTDVMGLSEAYYAMSGDIADRRQRFLGHIAHAEARGAALAERLPRAGRILEVGCGTGGLLAVAARAGLAIEGVDIASRWLIAARRRLSDHGLSVPLLAASAERLPWPDARFDAIVADSVLEHLDNPAQALCEWARVLRPGGRLIVWSPNRFTLTTDPHIGLWGLGWLPRRAVPAYLRLRGRAFWPPRTLSAREARRLATRAGLASVTVEPPAIPERWARTRPTLQRLAIRAYATARRLPVARGLLRTVGPLWELQAIKKKIS